MIFKWKYQIIVVVFVLFNTIYLQWPYLLEFPGHVHGWAQIDHFALTNGFLRNGFDLFRPETYVYNKIYPGEYLLQSSSSITAVDFPIHNYIVALIMNLFDIKNAVIYKLYVIFFGCIGLWYLSKLAYLILDDEVKALSVVAFASLSPLFAYYHGSLLPSIPCVTLTIIGIYFYFRFRDSSNIKHFYLSMFFFAISLLSRTTFVIPFIATLLMEFLSIVSLRKFDWKRYVPVLFVLVAFFLYRQHNNELHDTYGSMFLNKLRPPESLDDVRYLLDMVWNRWRLVYFSSMHYWAVVVVALLALVFYFKGAKLLPLSRSFFVYTAIYLFGCLLFAGAMLKQFEDHDYYFLDTFYLPCIFIWILLLSRLPIARIKWQRIIYYVALIAWVFFSFRMPVRSQRARHTDLANDMFQNTIENYTGAAEYLDLINLPRNATMLVVDAVAPNLALTLMERKGLVLLWPLKELIEYAYFWRFDYIVFQNEYFHDRVYRGYPEILNRLKKIASNGRITVCQVVDHNSQSLEQFLGQTETPIIEERIDFESENSGPWIGYMTNCDTAHTGNRSACFTKDFSSGLTLEWKNPDFLQHGYHPARMNFWVKTEDSLNADVVVWITCDGKAIFNEIRSLKDIIGSSSNWQNVDYHFVLPPVTGVDARLSVYLVNRSPTLLYYDDFSFLVYP